MALMLGAPCKVFAQPPVPDSLSVDLEEVTVKATPVIRKSDRDMYMPSAATKERSGGGLALLNNMQMPGVGINTFMKEIKVNGETPELRINNRRTTIEKVMALDPANIARVELITNPGVRYGKVPAVINIIVRNPDSGGFMKISGEQALSDFNFGNYDGAVSLNHGYSQFDINGYYSIRKNFHPTRLYNERFLLSDGHSVTRALTDTLGHAEMLWANINTAYSYSRPDKINIYTSFGFDRNFESYYYEGRTKADENMSGYTDQSFNPVSTPQLHFYMDYNLGRKQTLIFDADGSLGLGRSNRLNHEETLPQHETLVSVNNRIRSRNAGLALEGMYMKEWDASRFTAGVRYNLARNREEYNTGEKSVFHQRKGVETIFSEYMHRLGKITLRGGVSGEFWHSEYVENGKSTNDFMFTPDFTFNWDLGSGSNLTLNYSSYSTTPSLTETSVVTQQIDAYQVQRGNPDLKPFTTYGLKLSYGWSIPRFAGNLSARWSRSPGAIMEYNGYTPEGMIFNTWANSTGYTQYFIDFSPRITVVPGLLTINGTVSFCHYRNHGPNYMLISNSIYAEGTAQLTHKNFTLSIYAKKSSRNLWGQTQTRYEDFHMMNLSYRYRNFEFIATWLNPIGEYRGQEIEKRGPIAWSKNRFCTPVARTVSVGFNYKIDWGRKRNGIDRKANTSSGVEQTKAAGK